MLQDLKASLLNDFRRPQAPEGRSRGLGITYTPTIKVHQVRSIIIGSLSKQPGDPILFC
jgi:hypothetical protein